MDGICPFSVFYVLLGQVSEHGYLPERDIPVEESLHAEVRSSSSFQSSGTSRHGSGKGKTSEGLSCHQQ